MSLWWPAFRLVLGFAFLFAFIGTAIRGGPLFGAPSSIFEHGLLGFLIFDFRFSIFQFRRLSSSLARHSSLATALPIIPSNARDLSSSSLLQGPPSEAVRSWVSPAPSAHPAPTIVIPSNARDLLFLLPSPTATRHSPLLFVSSRAKPRDRGLLYPHPAHWHNHTTLRSLRTPLPSAGGAAYVSPGRKPWVHGV